MPPRAGQLGYTGLTWAVSLANEIDEIKLGIAVEYASEIREHITPSEFVDKYGIVYIVDLLRN